LFRRSALSSGLVSVEQILSAEKELRSAQAPVGTWVDISDEQLAARLVELGRLNSWQAEQLKVGRAKFTLGPYQIIDAIGQGGMGRVFRAEHRLMGRVVAIKVLPRDRSTPDAIASFTREIRAQAQFDHPNLVRAFDAGHDGNVYFLVTEFVPGTDLRKLVRVQGKLSMQDAATVILQAAQGLAHAHECGLVHRDVKPGNLLVTPSGQTKVSDLGLAGFLGPEDTDDPRFGRIVGTADYLSPEHISSPRNLSPASDVYSLGCTLYYAVTGKVPFPGGTSRDKARRHCEDAPINPRRFNLELSDEFVEVVAAMMDKNSDRRIGIDEVIKRLAPWAGNFVATTDVSEASSNTPSARSVLPSLSDTQPSLFDDLPPAQDESGASQVSQRTDPVASAQQETFADLPSSPALVGNEESASSGFGLLLLAPAVVAGLILAASMVLKIMQ
ncbi:MAG TPA: serine/threonine-protein kinase, partial [Pirellulales bacterium]